MPNPKLTLRVHPGVIEAAMGYASAHGTSVSALVEDLLAAVTSEGTPTPTSPVLARLRGALRGSSIEDHQERLAQKYLGRGCSSI